MNGESPKISPVSVFRNGAPGGSVSSRTTANATRKPYSA